MLEEVLELAGANVVALDFVQCAGDVRVVAVPGYGGAIGIDGLQTVGVVGVG